ncbi:MAG TPA: response regulator [Thermoanaerobaculia bacterium]|nr:response regulator [Thermoanaerobaculia bacterium]
MTNILIVDDNPTFRTQAARICEAEGFSTLSAGTLAELAALLPTAAPDLVLVDIELPEIPGHRLGALIRSRRPVPIVLVSALKEESVRRLFEVSDADGWICKPLTREKLLGAVTRFVLKKGEPQPAAPVTETPTGSGKRVLLVEDDPVIAARIEFALEKDCAVVTVDEGEAAIRHLLSENYDCVLLDLTLAHLSGFDVLRHMIVRQPRFLKATIIMTAATDESLQFIDRKAVAGVLRKPFDLGTLHDTVMAI